MPDVVYQAWRAQRMRAAQRGIAWELPYWEWLQIWQDSGHLAERGRNGGQWCMARHGDAGPYSAGNVSIVRVETNNREARATRFRNNIPVHGLFTQHYGEPPRASRNDIARA